MSTDKLFSVKQVAQLLGKKNSFVSRKIKKGEIKAKRVGWFWLISEVEVIKLQKLVAENKAE